MTSLRGRGLAGAIWWSTVQHLPQHAYLLHYLASQAARSQRMGREGERRAAPPKSPWKRLLCVLRSSSPSSWGRKRAVGTLWI